MPPGKFKTEEDNSDCSDKSLSEASTKRKPKMSDKITTGVLLKFIKPYNGDRESLPAFLTNCENAISLATTDQQNVLCKYIVSQLEGKAQLAICLKKYNTWPEIKDFLKTTFGEKKHSTHLLIELQNCKQSPSEDVTQYSLRLESCLTRIQSDIHYSCEDDKELIGRLAAMEDLAITTFLLGLNSNFSHIVRCRNPKTLSDAITNAVEEEKIFKLSKFSQRSAKQCSICQKTGHVASECYKNKNNKNNSTSNIYQVDSNYQNNRYGNKNNSNSNLNSNYNVNFNKSCAYCKKRGHLIGECRKLQYKNNNTRHDSRNTTLSGANAPSTEFSRSNVHCINDSKDNPDSDLLN